MKSIENLEIRHTEHSFLRAENGHQNAVLLSECNKFVCELTHKEKRKIETPKGNTIF